MTKEEWKVLEEKTLNESRLVPQSFIAQYTLGALRAMAPMERQAAAERITPAERLAINRANWGHDIPTFPNMIFLRIEES